MKKSIFCIFLTLCLILSFTTFIYADGIIGSIDADDTVTDPSKGTLEMTSSPSGAVAIGKDMATGNTYYYRVNGDILANNSNVSRSTNGMIPAEVAYNGSGNASPDLIIGADDRQKVTDTSTLPYSAIAYVRAIFQDPIQGTTVLSQGTAWMISPNAAVTAAHVIYDEELGWATSVIVVPGIAYDVPLWNTTGYLMGPYGYAIATELAISTQRYDTGSDNHDWGVLRLNSDIGLSSGYLGFQFCSYNLFNSSGDLRSLTISGYPYDKNNLVDSSSINDEYFQYVSSGLIVGDTTENASIPTYRIIEHRADTNTGQSGSPAIYQGKSVGILTKTASSNSNQCVGITSQLYSFLLAYS